MSFQFKTFLQFLVIHSHSQIISWLALWIIFEVIKGAYRLSWNIIKLVGEIKIAMSRYTVVLYVDQETSVPHCDCINRENNNVTITYTYPVLLLRNWMIICVEIPSTVSSPYSEFELHHTWRNELKFLILA